MLIKLTGQIQNDYGQCDKSVEKDFTLLVVYKVVHPCWCETECYISEVLKMSIRFIQQFNFREFILWKYLR